MSKIAVMNTYTESTVAGAKGWGQGGFGKGRGRGNEMEGDFKSV